MDVEQSAGTFTTPDIADKGEKPVDPSLNEERSIGHGENDVLGGENVDAVLAAKMGLVNDVSCKPDFRIGRACPSGRSWTELD